MKYINPNSKRGLVNKFAEFIVSELSKNSNHISKIQVTLFDAFFVIDGQTESTKILDMMEIQTKFYESNKDLCDSMGIKKINSIDIISYGNKPYFPSEQYFEFFNTERPILNKNIISKIKEIRYDYLSIDYTDKVEVEVVKDDSLLENVFVRYSLGPISSEFPYGYSLNTNRSHLYYSEYISNQLFKVILCEKIMFKYTNKIDSISNDLKIEIRTDSFYPDSDIESLTLDVFDFNIGNFIVTKLSNFDYNTSVDNQLSNLSWLEQDRLKDMLIF